MNKAVVMTIVFFYWLTIVEKSDNMFINFTYI